MKKTVLIRVICFILFVIFCGSVFSQVFAIDTNSVFNNLYTKQANDDANLVGKTKTMAQSIITIFQVVGTGIAVVMLIVLAMKYMMAAPGDKADIKKHAVVYVVGAFVLFAAVGILTIIQKFSGIVKLQ